MRLECPGGWDSKRAADGEPQRRYTRAPLARAARNLSRLASTARA